MTQKHSIAISGQVKITIKGPKACGKSQLAKVIADHLDSLNVPTVSYDSDTAKHDRRWRKPYSAEIAQVMIIQKQSRSA